MKSFQSTLISSAFMSWKIGWIAPDSSMVWVPTSKTWTMWGGFFCRYAAMAPVRTSGYVPLFKGLTSKSAWLWLNCLTSSLTVSPSCPPIACQRWISVFASAGVGRTTRSKAASAATARTRRFMKASMVGVRDSPVPGAPHYSTGVRPLRDARATRRLRPELVRARDVRFVGDELGLEPAGGPGEELRHPTPNRLRAVLPLAAARADARPSQQHVLERHGHFFVHCVVQLGHDVGVVGAQPFGSAAHLAGEVDHPCPAAAVRRHQRLQRLGVEPGGRGLAGDVEPRARVDPGHLLVRAVERDAVAAAGPRAAEGAHDLVAQHGRQAPKAGELGAGDRQEASPLLGDDLVGPRDVGLALTLLERERPHAGVRVRDLVQRNSRVGQDLVRLVQEVVHLVAGRVHAVQVAVEIAVGRPDERELAPRDDEDHAVVAGRVVDGTLGELRQQTVDALRPPEDPRAALGHTRGGAELVHPRAGRVDHDARAQRRDATGEQVADADPDDRAFRVPDDLRDLAVVEGPRAQTAGRENVLEAEALGEDKQVVEIVAGAAEVARPDHRLKGERVDRGQHPISLASPPRRQPVVELQPDPDLDEAPRGF